MNEDHDPVERRLRRHLSVVDAAPLPAADSVAASASRWARRRQVRARVAVGVVSAVAVVGAGALLSIRSPRQRVASAPSTAPVAATTPPPTVPVTTTTAPVEITPSGTGWGAVSHDPAGDRFDPAVVWTGREALVFGGTSASGVAMPGAAAFDPGAGTWRVISDPMVRTHSLAVWLGDRALLVGGDAPNSASVVAYQPSTDAWSDEPAVPAGTVTDRSPAVFTGSELLVWPDGTPSPFAFDPATGQWRNLPTPPIDARQSGASVWTGSEWLLWGGRSEQGEVADGAAYDPATDSWRALARSPLSARRVRAVWTGTEMLVFAGSRGGDPVTGNGELALDDGAAYSPASDSWRPMPSGLTHPGFMPVWTGQYLLMFAKGCAVGYDVATDKWIDGGCGGSGTPMWTGSVALLIGDGAVTFDPSVLSTSPAP
jgi:hypothetical protein